MRELTEYDRAIIKLCKIGAQRGFMTLLPPARAKQRQGRVYSDNDLLTPSKAAALLKIRPKTLANWRVAGSGPRFVKAGGRVVYRFHDLMTYVSQRSRLNTSQTGVEDRDGDAAI